eukprot:6986617-Alexandrium_andersonii.AAC.1
MPPRFAGDPQAVAQVLARHAHQPDFISYGESLTCSLQRTKILAVAAMWREVQQVHPSLAFSQRSMEGII